VGCFFFRAEGAAEKWEKGKWGRKRARDKNPEKFRNTANKLAGPYNGGLKEEWRMKKWRPV
jgi:hypothetical protein